MQLAFLNMVPTNPVLRDVPSIDGLIYIPEFITVQEHSDILDFIDTKCADQWLGEIARRVQHYGFRYNYKARQVDSSARIGPLPSEFARLGERLVKGGWFSQPPDQAIVNEYQPGQGISAHVDCVPCFGPVVASLSLGSPCLMDFHRKSEERSVHLWLEPRSLLILSEEARYLWTHSIAGRRADKLDGKIFERGRRVSITFRTVITDQPKRRTRLRGTAS